MLLFSLVILFLSISSSQTCRQQWPLQQKVAGSIPDLRWHPVHEPGPKLKVSSQGCVFVFFILTCVFAVAELADREAAVQTYKYSSIFVGST